MSKVTFIISCCVVGSVYENSKDLRKNNDNDEVYANAANHATADNKHLPKKVLQ